jgi:hypothetical protein
MFLKCTVLASPDASGPTPATLNIPLSTTPLHGVNSQKLRIRRAHQPEAHKMDSTAPNSWRRTPLRPRHMEDRL